MARSVGRRRAGARLRAARQKVEVQNMVEERKSSGLRPLHGLALVAVGVVGVLVAFWALSFIAGLVWGFVKAAIVVALVLGVLWLILRRR